VCVQAYNQSNDDVVDDGDEDIDTKIRGVTDKNSIFVQNSRIVGTSEADTDTRSGNGNRKENRFDAASIRFDVELFG